MNSQCETSADVLYLEAKDNGPNETEGKAMVAINNIMRSNVLQMNSLFFKELQGFVHILQTVYSHSASRRSGLRIEKKRNAS